MPPRKRKRASGSQSIASPTGSATNRSSANSSPASRPSISVAVDDDSDLPPFLNTTFSTHRVSPLYIGAFPLTQDRLHTLSLRLRDLLVGDVVRGVEVGLDRGADDAAMRRAGALELVSVGWARLESLVGRYVAGDNEETSEARDRKSDKASGAQATTPSPGKRRALQISLQYENTECVALLLPGTNSPLQPEEHASSIHNTPTSVASSDLRASKMDGADSGFLNLPLLLLRMPAPLKTVIIDFISRTFDCRISSLSLGTRSLVGALERWMENSRIPTKGPLAKDVVLTLGFYGPTVLQGQKQKGAASEEHPAEHENDDDAQKQTTTLGMKALDVIVPNSELRRFFRAGEMHESRRRARIGQFHDDHNDADDLRDEFGHMKRRKMGGDKEEESWTWRRWDTSSSQSATKEESIRSQPFTEALAEYVRVHLALNIFHPAVRVTKIACGGFVLSEGRFKVFGTPPSDDGEDGMSDRNQRAVWSVLDNLLGRAQVKPLESTLSSIAV